MDEYAMARMRGEELIREAERAGDWPMAGGSRAMGRTR
jgi:hypothetical protein